nr:MAG TPA: RNA polymerase subunit [Caudoviricetes sp.]
MLDSGFLTNKRMYELNILAKYFFYLGYKPKEVQERVVDFCNNYFDSFSEAKYFDKIQSILNNARKMPIIEVGTIQITEKEVEFINSIKEPFKFNDVLFCLLVIKKIREKLGQQPYLNCKYTKFTKSCGLSSPKVLYPLLRRLEQLGFIRVCRNSNLEILFNVDASNSPTVIEVNDFDNIYAYYHNYLGKGRYVECSSCGKMVRVKGNRRKYCNECARIINIQKTLERKKV